MINHTLLDELKTRGFVETSRMQLWEEASCLLAAIDAIGREGVSAVIKVDGKRDNGLIYTIVLSGGSLGESYFHRDSDDLLVALQEAVAFYNDNVWSKKR